MRRFNILTALVVLVWVSQPCLAERKYVLGTQLDFMGGVSNSLGGMNNSQLQVLGGVVPYFSLFPTIGFNSIGSAYKLTASYSFMWERFENQSRLSAAAHMADITFSSRLSERVHLSVHEAFYSTPNYRGYMVFKGVENAPDEFVFLYDTLFAERASTSNTGSATLDVELTPRSSLSLTGASAFRQYTTVSGPAIGYFSDQMRTDGSVAYVRHRSRRQVWTVKCSVVEYQFKKFGNARNYIPTLAISEQLSPSLHLQLEAGPSLSRSALMQNDRWGYVVYAYLTKSFRSNMIRLSYAHRSMETTGLGSMSDMDSGSLDLTRSFGAKLKLNFTGSGVNSKPRVDNPLSAHWFYGSAALSYALTNRWLLVLGGTYRRTSRIMIFGQEYKRVYLSIRFQVPELWKGAR